MAQDGLQLQELFTNLPLCKEDKAVLLRAVRKAEPTFLPPQPPLPSFKVNTSPLLKEIYSTVSFSLQVGSYHVWAECRSSCPYGASGASALPLFLLTELPAYLGLPPCSSEFEPAQSWQVPGPQQGHHPRVEAGRCQKEEKPHALRTPQQSLSCLRLSCRLSTGVVAEQGVTVSLKQQGQLVGQDLSTAAQDRGQH